MSVFESRVMPFFPQLPTRDLGQTDKHYNKFIIIKIVKGNMAGSLTTRCLKTQLFP